MAETFTCEKCGKIMDGAKFYQYKDGSKTKLCKNCLTMHIDNFNPKTFLWILEDMDLPYVPVEWNVLRDKAFAKNPNLTGLSVIGKYISKMKCLKQYKDYGWADSERLQALKEEKSKAKIAEKAAAEEALKAQLSQGLISEAQYRTMMSTETLNEEYRNSEIAIPIPANIMNPYENPNVFMAESEIDLGADLTEDDKKALAMKWGRLYKPSEWVELEKTYKEMTESFDIQDADTVNTLILICKTNLKMNQYLDQGDIEGFQKISKVSESLRKSAKFTAAQNKEQKEDYVDSVGELINLCEKEGFIPRYITDVPQDKVDITLQDMNEYVKKLVTQDLGFGKRIEDAIKKIQIQHDMAEAIDQDSIELDDDDFREYHEAIAAQKALDELALDEGDDE